MNRKRDALKEMIKTGHLPTGLTEKEQYAVLKEYSALHRAMYVRKNPRKIRDF